MAEEPAFVIDGNLRTVSVPEGYEVAGVESDKDVNRIRFECPRFVDGTDLSRFSIYINYLNANGDGDIHIVQDVEAGDDSLEFSWLVGRNALAYAGKLSFAVCMVLHKADGITIDREFNTTIAQVSVLRGLEVAAANEMDFYDALAKLTAQWSTAADALVSAKLNAFDSASSAKLGDFDAASATKLSQYDSNVADKLSEVPGLVEDIVGDSISSMSGFVSKSGDTMTGDLKIQKDTLSTQASLTLKSTTESKDSSYPDGEFGCLGSLDVRFSDDSLASMIGGGVFVFNGKKYIGTALYSRRFAGKNRTLFVGQDIDTDENIVIFKDQQAWLSALGITDNIVAEGYSNGCYYMKFESGYAFVFGKATATSECKTTWGNGYESSALQITWPFEFRDVPYEIGQVYGSGNSAITSSYPIEASMTTKSKRYSQFRPTQSNSQTLTLIVFAFGLWR